MNDDLRLRFATARAFTEELCRPLEVEDFVVQAMPDASPTRWHLAHTTWFFETFLLSRWRSTYRPLSAEFNYLFNSYYNGVGEPFPRSQRGLLTRPTVEEVFAYRHAVDECVSELLASSDDAELSEIVELGIQHEQQHQELIVTDVKYLFGCNPLAPVYRDLGTKSSTHLPRPARWESFSAGPVWIGHDGPGFSFDNERPRHQVLLRPFELQDRLVTSGEYLEFMQDGGYRRPELWLSLGWTMVGQQAWTAPLYWSQRHGQWSEFTLGGIRPVEPQRPVAHVSYFEADAYARWRGVRLPTEAEWEFAAMKSRTAGSFLEGQHFHPVAVDETERGLAQMFGEVWQWTQSPYTPYPGYVPAAGALGEYNGKFMCNQYVLRGGSCATPASHIRPSYRNFFPAEARWQFSGIRLAKDAVAGSK
jgi:ergothioneine biosynthesis protein EgtB